MQTIIQHGDVKTVVALQDGNLITGTIQDCTPILEDAQARHKEGMHGDKEFRHAARTPNVIIETYCNNHHLSLADFWRDPKHIKAILNDPDLKAFRIWPGRC